MTYKDYFRSLKGKKVAVLGIGVSNTPLIKILVEYGAIVTACDKRENIGKELEGLNVNLALGENYLDNLDHEVIFRSPGIREDLPQLLAQKEKGSIITSEMEVFFEYCPAQILAITGSDGKTTTTTLTYEILKEEGYTCHLGGNIGKPLLAELENIKENHKVVLELSSFQLQTIKKCPSVAVITNIAPNHLDWHKSMEEYILAKKNIYLNQTTEGRLVTNFDNEITSKIYNEAKGETILFSRKKELNDGIYIKDGYIYVKDVKIMRTDEILLPGVHNIENYMAAIGATWGMVSIESIKKVATTFSKIPHRIEFIKEIDGVKYYNDSIATSPTRAIAGLNSFNKKVIMIAGGYDKKIPFDVLGDIIVNRVKKLVLVGATAEKIKNVVVNAKTYSEGVVDIKICTSLSDALNEAKATAQDGDVVILCPACASFDMYKNFEERGNEFKRLVESL